MRTSVTHTYESYRDICKAAAKDDEVFNIFKSLPFYRQVLEHARYEHGLDHLKSIAAKTPELLELFPKFLTNDKYGSTIKEVYKNPLDGSALVCSPTTIQYVKVLSDLKMLYGSLDGMEIIEIGGGYGGQSKIIHDLFDIKRYTIIDLPEPLALTNKYLNLFDIYPVVVDAISYLDNPTELKSDLIISNFAFSEILKPQQEAYINFVLNHAERGYMTCNQVFTKKFGNDLTYTMEELKQKIKKDMSILSDIPSEHNLNYIFSW